MAKGTTSSSAQGKSTTIEKVGVGSFVIGALIAIILGFVPSIAGAVWVIWLLLALGIIVGFLNISEKEIMPFLIACVAFLVAASAFRVIVSDAVGGFAWLDRILAHLAILVLPGAIIASIRAIFALASSR